MPKKLEELKGFTGGIVSSPSSLDVPKEVATYSLNIDSNLKQGSLIGIKEDKVLSYGGFLDKRYANYELTLVEHSGSFDITNYSANYFLWETFGEVYLVWLSNNLSANSFKDVNISAQLQWQDELNLNPDLIDLKLDIDGATSTAEVAEKIITVLNEQGPGSGSYLSNNVATTWFDVSLLSSYNADLSTNTVISFVSNYLGDINFINVDLQIFLSHLIGKKHLF